MDAPTARKLIESLQTLYPYMNDGETQLIAVVLNGVTERLLKESEEEV